MTMVKVGKSMLLIQLGIFLVCDKAIWTPESVKFCIKDTIISNKKAHCISLHFIAFHSISQKMFDDFLDFTAINELFLEVIALDSIL